MELIKDICLIFVLMSVGGACIIGGIQSIMNFMWQKLNTDEEDDP